MILLLNNFILLLIILLHRFCRHGVFMTQEFQEFYACCLIYIAILWTCITDSSGSPA